MNAVELVAFIVLVMVLMAVIGASLSVLFKNIGLGAISKYPRYVYALPAYVTNVIFGNLLGVATPHSFSEIVQ